MRVVARVGRDQVVMAGAWCNARHGLAWMEDSALTDLVWLRRTAAILVTPVLILLMAPAALAVESVECGLISSYTAPDASGPTDGSIAFGLDGPVETIAADATLVPPVDTNLPGITGGAPTCLTVNRDADVIDSLAFAASGSITGPVTFVADLFGAGSDGYTVSDRLVVPIMIATDNLGLAALIPTAADAGVDLTIGFVIDGSTGFPSSFSANTTMSGPILIEPDGDVRIGAATLPAGVIDGDSMAAFEAAAALGVDATVIVTGAGTPDQASPGGVNMVITLAVSFTAPATPGPTASEVPDTAVGGSDRPSNGTASTAGILIVVAAGVLAVLAPTIARRRARSAD
jgi:hypothetical protein